MTLRRSAAHYTDFRTANAARPRSLISAMLTSSGGAVLTPLELITKIAAIVPPPRAHRHRYYGVSRPMQRYALW